MASDERWCILHADASVPASRRLSSTRRPIAMPTRAWAVGAILDDAATWIEATAARLPRTAQPQ